MARLGVTSLAKVDLDLRQGSDCPWAVVYSERDPNGSNIMFNTFVGWSARAQLRSRVGGELWLSLTSDDLITLSVDSNRLTVSGNIPHAVTEASVWDDRTTGVWDVELVRQNGTVIPLVGGSVIVTHDVTRF